MLENYIEQSKDNIRKGIDQSSAQNNFSYTSTLKPKSFTAILGFLGH